MTNIVADQLYPNAPITEAVIDLRVELPTSVVIDDLAKMQDRAGAGYFKAGTINQTIGHLQIGGGANSNTQAIGFRFQSTDSKQIYQARMNGFTLSRLQPYTQWGEFCAEARRLWDVYRIVANPAKIARVAVRYINRIDIPLPLHDFGEYLRTVPQVSPDLPGALSGYFMQLVMPLEDIKGSAVINEMIVDPPNPHVVSVVLDIDIFRSDDIPNREDELWALIDRLRGAKNWVFEASITDKARELFR